MNTTIIRTLEGTVLAAVLVLSVGCGGEGGISSQGTTEATSAPSRQLIGFMGARQEDSDLSIFVMNADGTNQKRLAPALIAPPSAGVWSPDRTTLAYLDRDLASHKYWFSLVDANGANQRKVTDLSPGLPTSWSWSADGERILMICSTGGQAEPKPGGGVDERYYSDIFSMDVKTGEMKRLTDSKSVAKSTPLGSPDGRRIAFSGSEHDPETWNISSYGIFAVSVDGSGETKLLDSPTSIRSFQWSPDGKDIVYDSYDDKKGTSSADIYVLDVQSGASINLTNSPDAADLDPIWSPDGKRIAFSSGDFKEGFRLRVMDFDGKRAVDLADLSDYSRAFASWAADSKSIVFTKDQTIYSVGVDGKAIEMLFDGTRTYRDIMFPVWLSE